MYNFFDTVLSSHVMIFMGLLISLKRDSNNKYDIFLPLY